MRSRKHNNFEININDISRFDYLLFTQTHSNHLMQLPNTNIILHECGIHVMWHRVRNAQNAHSAKCICEASALNGFPSTCKTDFVVGMAIIVSITFIISNYVGHDGCGLCAMLVCIQRAS